jgi:hypothetical protein
MAVLWNKLHEVAEPCSVILSCQIICEVGEFSFSECGSEASVLLSVPRKRATRKNLRTHKRFRSQGFESKLSAISDCD